MPGKSIQVGQRWRTRCGREVWVSADRHEGHSGWPGVEDWRWAISTGEIVNDRGECGFNGEEHASDLIELLGTK